LSSVDNRSGGVGSVRGLGSVNNRSSSVGGLLRLRIIGAFFNRLGIVDNRGGSISVICCRRNSGISVVSNRGNSSGIIVATSIVGSGNTGVTIAIGVVSRDVGGIVAVSIVSNRFGSVSGIGNWSSRGVITAWGLGCVFESSEKISKKSTEVD